MYTTPLWLAKLKANELRRLAVRLGTPCSGTKPVLTHGIQYGLARLPSINRVSTLQNDDEGDDHLSLVSIDMGIRNLAYTHWTARLASSKQKGEEVLRYAQPVLKAWRKIDVPSQLPSSPSLGTIKDEPMAAAIINGNNASGMLTRRETFEPIDYAKHAYSFVKSILDEHKPSHVLIERQRFRSGGNSAVLEWTLRVGVFEGMLYAVLRSLAAEQHRYSRLSVEPILPTRVNRYWLEDYLNDEVDMSDRTNPTKTSREVKQIKIELVRRFLRNDHAGPESSLFTIDHTLADVVSAFQSQKSAFVERVSARKSRAKVQTQTRLSMDFHKFDDLADCFLQGLAWIHWQNNRLECKEFEDKKLPITSLLDWLNPTPTYEQKFQKLDHARSDDVGRLPATDMEEHHFLNLPRIVFANHCSYASILGQYRLIYTCTVVMAAPKDKTLQNLGGNWTLNREFSDDPSAALKLQDVNFIIRKASTSATVHLKVSQQDENSTTMAQSATAVKIPGTVENYTLDWQWRSSYDTLFGDIEGRSRWINVEDARREGVSGDWIEGDSEGKLIEAEGKKPDDAWIGTHFWGFEEVGGVRRHTRRVKIRKDDGQEVNMRMVYDFDGE